MDEKTTGIIEDRSTLYCPSCGKSRDDIKEADDELFSTFCCMNCGEALGVGILLGLKVICPKCRMMVIVG